MAYNFGDMHSLESEYLELNAAGLIDKTATTRAIALDRGEMFSVFEEVRFALYAAVGAITTGFGILVKDNLDRIGPLTLIAILTLVSVACYGTAIRTRLREETRTIGGDYLLLLGALMMSADLGYAESQFHWLGSYWSWHLLILAVLHAITAYVLDSRLVLSVSVTSLAAWFGIEEHIASLFNSGSPLRNSGLGAMVCASVILTWREIHRRVGGPAAFNDVFEHFAANLGFWGAIVLCSMPNTRFAALAALVILAVISVRKGLRVSQEMFVIYGIAYTALGLCLVEAQIVSGSFAVLLELTTVIIAVISLWRFRHRTKATAS